MSAIDNAHQITNAYLVLLVQAIAQVLAFRSECNENDTTIMCVRCACDKMKAFQSVNDSRDVTLVCEQEATEVNHRTPLFAVQVLKRPKLTCAQPMLCEEVAIPFL